ncbi:hypothetical protein DQ384_34700 [Sphaerisporangium album]|uniref:Streptomyces killer toxin-like beta/gamma crystallin domain-containing protein n=1 Tax=Sphaerisporangium album TaxID=509200 RepID=A0A367EXA8_9ACTN|nr:hypothetical protein [Sphaerisporangium album]RCG22758.1 hypothetical protein DQ384_34700 [Sphaerisporangium album]
MLKKIARRAAVLPLIFTALLAAQPADAASGGGCTGAYPISSCISVSGVSVVADFYMNATPDTSRCWAQMEVRTTTHGTYWSARYRIDRTGRFGPISGNINSMPWKNGSAVNIVHVTTCSGSAHGDFTSPRVYY